MRENARSQMVESQTLYHLLFATCGIGLLIRQTWLCVENFVADESSMSSTLQSTSKAQFPALTICPDYEDAFNASLAKKIGVSTTDLRNSRFTKINDTSSTTLEHYERVTHDISEVIDDFTVLTLKPLAGTTYSRVFFVQDPDYWSQKVSKAVQVKKLDETEWTRQNYQVFGRCYTYDAPDDVHRAEITSVKVTVKMPALMYIHHPGQFFWVDTKGGSKVPIPNQGTMFLNTQHSVTQFRPHTELWKFGKNGSQSNSHCNEVNDRGYDSCLATAYDQFFWTHFGCFYPLMTNQPDHKDYCNFSNFTEKQKDDYNLLYKGMITIENIASCQAPCSTIETNFGIPQVKPYSHKHLQVYFKNLITVKKSHISYPIESLFAELGGYLGLLLGVSLMDIKTVIEKSIKLMCNFKK